MNKTTRAVIAVILVVLSISGMAMIQNLLEKSTVPKNITQLWDKIDETMSKVSSLELTVTTERVYYYMGNRYEHNGTNYILTEKDVAHYTEIKNVIRCEDLELEETMEMVEAYYDGKMYRAIKNGVYDQKISSPITHEEYDQTQSGEQTAHIPLSGCTEATFSGSEEEGWVLTFGNYTQSAIAQTLEDYGLAEDTQGYVIEDIQVVITVSGDYHVQSIDVDFQFREGIGEGEPSISIRTTYAGYNEVSFDPARLDVEQYTQVADVRLLDTLSVAIARQQNLIAGQFEYTRTITESKGDTTTPYRENVQTHYGWEGTGYYYQASSDQKNWQYQDGQQTVQEGEASYTEPMTEEEAKAWVDSLIDAAKYDPFAIDSIEKRGEGVYLLTTDQPNLYEYEKVEITSAQQQITVTFRNGKLVKIESVVNITGTSEGKDVEIISEAVVEFTSVTA